MAPRILDAQRTARAGPSKGRDHAAAVRADLAPAEARDLRAHDPGVLRVELARGGVAHAGRPGDVGEEQGGEHPVGHDVVADSGEESFVLVEQRLAVALPRQVVAAGQLDEVGPAWCAGVAVRPRAESGCSSVTS
jgi:hypothetical protein